jgi:hypothetical protein
MLNGCLKHESLPHPLNMGMSRFVVARFAEVVTSSHPRRILPLYFDPSNTTYPSDRAIKDLSYIYRLNGRITPILNTVLRVLTHHKAVIFPAIQWTAIRKGSWLFVIFGEADWNVRTIAYPLAQGLFMARLVVTYGTHRA